MKKVAVVFMCIALLLCFAACNVNGFMSASKVKKLTAEFGTPQPQAEMSVKYTIKGQEIELRITYNILLEKTPIASIHFINLVNDGFYNDAIFDTYNKSLQYLVGGRYKYAAETEGGSTFKYMENVETKSFVGEFATNGYKEPNGGYATFKLLSLAMYHDGSADDFNSANGTLIMATGSQTLQSSNYAVFAEMVKVEVYKDGEFSQRYDLEHMSGNIISQLTMASGTSRTVTLRDGTTASRTLLGDSNVSRYVMSVKMLGDTDWSKLPKVD